MENANKDLSKFYLLEPDYDRPIFEVPRISKEKIMEKLELLYGKEVAEPSFQEIERIIKVHYAYKTPEMIEQERDFNPTERFTEKDIILITYGDLIQGDDQLPLEVLADFSDTYLNGGINTLHILPFFPYSSDRGFSIIDFEEVDPRLGTWENIEALKARSRLMFDGVFNHISAKSRWFQEFLDGNPEYQDFFITFSTKDVISEDHLKLIVRPRVSELLTPFSTLNGKRSVWTTFSPDQIDLNFKNPKVLLKMTEILLTYIRRGADIIRLDAVTYLWSELGTSCVHLNETHLVIKLFRDILDAIAPNVAIITETNVPHEENIQYFGDGHNEAQMVYNFALPPLVLHSFQTGSSVHLTRWASGLTKVSDEATYFNFLDSHDGIGVSPVKNILSKEEIEMMALRVLEHGGFISYKDNGDGTLSPYELNVTWYSAMNREDSDESEDFQIRRFIASRSIAMVIMGVPGIYLPSLFGSKNDADTVVEKGETRNINRRTYRKESLYKRLDAMDTPAYKVSRGLRKMVQKRIKEDAFHPNADQRVLDVSDSVFALIRTSVDKKERILTITNISDNVQDLKIEAREISGEEEISCHDILSDKRFISKGGMLSMRLEPYDVLWLKQR
ncbi:MAG: sugar phosphorylase [Thermodesulfobacteriota bacterium]|nr:sugar phosphorylase [Thermodesulfobacteriota bacterium]